jgi:hypothetical protein
MTFRMAKEYSLTALFCRGARLILRCPECGRRLGAPIPEGRSQSGRYNGSKIRNPKFQIRNGKHEYTIARKTVRRLCWLRLERQDKEKNRLLCVFVSLW